MTYIMGGCIGGGGGYPANAVYLNGSTYLYKSGALSGVSDSKTFTLSFWERAASATATMRVLSFGNTTFTVSLSTSGLLIIGERSGTVTLRLSYNLSDVVSDMLYYHFAVSVDLSDTNKRHLIVNNVDETAGGNTTWGTYDNFAINFSTASFVSVGANYGGGTPTSHFIGDLAEVFFDTQYRDISTAAELRRFITPTNITPRRPEQGDIWLSGNTADWHTNKGAGGGFIEVGTLTTSSNLPVIVGG